MASHNLFIQAIFDEMTAPAGRALYYTTEFGCGLVLTTGAIAVWLWTRRNELPRSNQLQQVASGTVAKSAM